METFLAFKKGSFAVAGTFDVFCQVLNSQKPFYELLLAEAGQTLDKRPCCLTIAEKTVVQELFLQVATTYTNTPIYTSHPFTFCYTFAPVVCDPSCTMKTP
jgi:hypothetical protein